jgi:hypothetical protein
MRTLSASLNSQDVLDLATAIKLLVDHAEDYPMPDGQPSMTALLSNTTVREELIDAAYLLDQAAFVATQNSIVSDATLVKPITPSSVPGNLIATTLPSDLPNTYAGVDRAIAYTFDVDGTGTATSSYWHRNMTWSVSGGSIDIVYASPIQSFGIERGVCPEVPGFGYGVQEITFDYTSRGATLRQLSDHILAVTEDRLISYRDCGPTGETETFTTARTIIDSSNTQSIDAADLGDTTRTLWVYDEVSDPHEDDPFAVIVMPDIADLHADGTGTTRVFGKTFTWALDANAKVVTATFADGTVAKYRSLRDVEDVATDVFYDLTLPNGNRHVGASVSILADEPAFSFTPNNVVGRHYWLGIGDAGAPPEIKGYRSRLDADGTGSREDEIVDESGNVSVLDVTEANLLGLNWGLFWHLDGHDLILERTRDSFDSFNCSLLDDPQCVVYDQRRHIPLASDGARSYSLVRYLYDGQGVDESSSRQTYIAMYDYEPFGEAAPSSSKPMLATKNRVRQGGAIAPAQLKQLRERRERR